MKSPIVAVSLLASVMAGSAIAAPQNKGAVATTESVVARAEVFAPVQVRQDESDPPILGPLLKVTTDVVRVVSDIQTLIKDVDELLGTGNSSQANSAAISAKLNELRVVANSLPEATSGLQGNELNLNAVSGATDIVSELLAAISTLLKALINAPNSGDLVSQFGSAIGGVLSSILGGLNLVPGAAGNGTSSALPTGGLFPAGIQGAIH